MKWDIRDLYNMIPKTPNVVTMNNITVVRPGYLEKPLSYEYEWTRGNNNTIGVTINNWKLTSLSFSYSRQEIDYTKIIALKRDGDIFHYKVDYSEHAPQIQIRFRDISPSRISPNTVSMYYHSQNSKDYYMVKVESNAQLLHLYFKRKGVWYNIY